MRPDKITYRNHLLLTLAGPDLAALTPFLSPVELNFRMVLEAPDQPIARVCFPDSGIISVIAKSTGVNALEVGLIGLEGMTGLSIVMGDRRSPQETYVQVAGSGHWMPAEALHSLLPKHPAMREAMLNFGQVFMTQMAQTALANGRATIDQRLARWLLMAEDRVGGFEMPLTHELLALMLGVRRPGITDALHRLEGNLLIRAKRAAVTVRDRGALETLASGSYGVPEREYHRLLGALAKPYSHAPSPRPPSGLDEVA